MPTQIYTTVTIGDQRYSIKRFDAKTGLKIARFVIAKGAPLLPLLGEAIEENGKKKPESGKAKSEQDAAKTADLSDHTYQIVGDVFGTFSDEDIDEIVDKCLRVCYLELPAGPQAVIDEYGNYGVEDVEYDMALTLRLCFEAIKWGASDFFGEKGSALTRLIKQTGSSPNP